MKNLRLSMKLIGGFLIVALIGAVIGYIGKTRIQSINESYSAMFEHNAKPLGEIAQASTSYQRSRANMRDLFMDNGDQERKKTLENIKDRDKEVVQYLAAFEKTIRENEVRKEFEILKDSVNKFQPIKEKFIQLLTKNDTYEALQLMRGEGEIMAGKIEGSMKRLMDLNIALAAKQAGELSGTADRTITSTLMITIGGAILAVLLGTFLTVSVTRPISRIVSGLTQSSAQVASASSQVSSASQSLSGGASEQAAGIEETTSSMEEMSAMTRQNAENANQAKIMMGEAAQIVAEVNTQMRNMAGAIEEITKSSEETGKIIKTIDEIAFQTNLLALNAAVEAARAGEAGAGFAVVADEVRNLALRAAEAAKNTNRLIENTIGAVKKGNDLTLTTQEAFKKNMEISSKIGNLIEEIAAASQEQAQGIGQVTKAIGEMDRVVQKNAATAEESASASEEMNAQAVQMKEFVRELTAVIGGQAEIGK